VIFCTVVAGGGSGGGAAGGEHVVDDQHAVVLRQRVVMDLERVGTVFEDVFVAASCPRKLAGFADRHEAGAEDSRDAAAEDESARLDAGDERDTGAPIRFGELVDASLQSARRTEKRRDVLEHDPGLRKVRDLADKRLECSIHLRACGSGHGLTGE